jgi:hypothetical protein
VSTCPALTHPCCLVLWQRLSKDQLSSEALPTPYRGALEEGATPTIFAYGEDGRLYPLEFVAGSETAEKQVSHGRLIEVPALDNVRSAEGYDSGC